jgi:FtsZ-binding cell division protein ZapB
MTTMETLLDDASSGVVRMRGIYEQWERLRKAQQAYIQVLEAERDALRAENADLREDEQEALEERNAALKQRDALRAQLDGMTTETRDE